MAETKGAFRRRLGRLLHILKTSTLDGAGSTTTFTCLALTDTYSANDTLNGVALYDVTGSQWRRVTDWNGVTGAGTVNRAYSASQDSGRSVEAYEQFTPDDLDEALRQALVEAYPYITTRVIDTSLTFIASQYEYSVPATIRDLDRMRGGRVQWRPYNLSATFPYADIEHWEVVESGGATKTLVIPVIEGKIGRTIRLIGWGIPAFPSTDATSIDLEDDVLQLLAYKAAEIAWRTGPSLTGRDAEFAQTMSSYYRTLYETQKDSWGVRMVPTKLESPDGVILSDAPLAYYHATPS